MAKPMDAFSLGANTTEPSRKPSAFGASREVMQAVEADAAAICEAIMDAAGKGRLMKAVLRLHVANKLDNDAFPEIVGSFRIMAINFRDAETGKDRE